MFVRPSRSLLKVFRTSGGQKGPSLPTAIQFRSYTTDAFKYRWGGIAAGGLVALGVYTGYLLNGNEKLAMEPVLHTTDSGLISYSEVLKHNNTDSCWMIIEGRVYDVTTFLDQHPGGAGILLKNSGRDSTKAFLTAHTSQVLRILPQEAYVGQLDPSTFPRHLEIPTEDEMRIATARALLPPPSAVLNLREIEKLAQSVLSQTAWAYYRSAGDDEHTYRENFAAFDRFWFRPRVLAKVTKVATATEILSHPTSLPIFIAPAALARLGHPDGEMNLVRAAGKEGILQAISNNASCSIDEIVSAKLPNQSLFFQLYLDKNRLASAELIKRVEDAGFKAIMLTVDAPVPGNRELDRRTQLGDFSGPAHGKSSNGGGGVANAISAYQANDISWDDVAWLKKRTKLPIVIKGISCVEDAEKAFSHGAQAIVISNHGGRELDFSPAPMTVLHELHEKRPDLLRKHEVYIDGGVTRGTDVLKALCLGARAVGLGRAFLYANGVWGEEGCKRVIQIMREEIERGMRLLGVTSLDQLGPEHIRYVDRSRT